MSINNRFNTQAYQEKRDFMRMWVDSPVAVKPEGQDLPMEGLCRNLSGGGMLVDMDTPLPTGTRAEVTLTSSHGHAPMLRAAAIVTRACTQPEPEGRPYRVALRLKEILL